MGYSTDFTGTFRLDRSLAAPQAEYLRRFSETRRMRRNEVLLEEMPDPHREAVGASRGTRRRLLRKRHRLRRSR